MFKGVAKDGRRSEAIWSCRTLDDLHTELNAAGFVISWSAMYLRLLPKCANSIEGKHHVVTVPVKLKRPESNLLSKHPVGYFCKASYLHLKNLHRALEHRVSSWARMTNVECPLVWRPATSNLHFLCIWIIKFAYQITIGLSLSTVSLSRACMQQLKFTLLNSVTELLLVTVDPLTLLFAVESMIRQLLWIMHLILWQLVLEMDEFRKFAKAPVGNFKTVVIITVDGRPDENPRYAKETELYSSSSSLITCK